MFECPRGMRVKGDVKMTWKHGGEAYIYIERDDTRLYLLLRKCVCVCVCVLSVVKRPHFNY